MTIFFQYRSLLLRLIQDIVKFLLLLWMGHFLWHFLTGYCQFYVQLPYSFISFFFIFQLVLLHFLGIKILYHKNHHMKTVLFLSFQYFLLITLDKKIFHHKNNRENIVLFTTFIFLKSIGFIFRTVLNFQKN